MKRKVILSILITGIFLLLIPLRILAQQEQELDLRLKRNFGYGGGDEIQGVFTMQVNTPAELSRVEFYIDDQKIGEDDEIPYSLKFSTDNYSKGLHSLKAIGYTKDGNIINSNVIPITFVSAEEGWKAGFRIVGPMLGIIVAIMLFALLLTVFTSKRKVNISPGTERKYGFSGGAICPKCNRPTPLHVLGFNLLIAKYDRCENCGKWSVMRIQPLNALRQAEREELERAKQEGENRIDASLSDEEKIKKELEDSRFQNL
jgi:hypothetical protein